MITWWLIICSMVSDVGSDCWCKQWTDDRYCECTVNPLSNNIQWSSARNGIASYLVFNISRQQPLFHFFIMVNNGLTGRQWWISISFLELPRFHPWCFHRFWPCQTTTAGDGLMIRLIINRLLHTVGWYICRVCSCLCLVFTRSVPKTCAHREWEFLDLVRMIGGWPRTTC